MSHAVEHPRVADLFEQYGEEQWVAGNTPFLLSGSDRVWLVTAGRVELFFVVVENGRPEGSRHHYLMAEPGDLLFGMDLDRYGDGQGFLVVGAVGTRLLNMSANRLRAGEDTGAGDLPDLIDRWVSGLSTGSSRGIVPRPRADSLLDAGDEADVADGKRLRARKGVVWVQHQHGQSLFLGMEETGGPADGLFPVTAETWLQALGPAGVSTFPTPVALRDGRVWEGLESFYNTLFRCEYFNTRLASADELNRLKEKTDRDRRIKQAALVDLASVLARRPGGLARGSVEDPLLAAFTLVGRHVGVEIKAPPKPRDGEMSDDPARDIARASRVRVREVVLKGRWWRLDTTPIVAFLSAGHEPVAILPRRGRLELHNPAGGEPQVVTAAVASRLEAEALVVYRPFPDRVLTPWDIFRFGAALERRDFVITMLVGLGAGALALLTPFFLGLLVDVVLPHASRSGLLMLALVLTAVGISTTMFDTVRALGAVRLEIKLSGTVQPAMWDRLLKLPASFFRRYTSGDLAERVAYVDAIRKILTGATVDSLMTGVFSVFLFALLFYYSWTLALVASALVVVSMAITAAAVYSKLQLQRSVIAVEGQIVGLVLQLLTGIGKLRVTGAEGRAFAEWATAFAGQKRLEMRTGEIEARLEVFNSAFPILSTICLFAVMMSAVQHSTGTDASLSTGDFIAFNAAFGTFIAETQRLAVASLSVLSVVPLFERARPILEARPEVDTTKTDPGELSGLIEVDHLSFHYQADGPLVLDDVSLRILPGEFVAIVGPSGSGKSTFLRVLLGLETPETGSVYYDGRDLTVLDVQKLRRRIGVVMQTAKVRAGTIYENIVGAGRYTLDDAWTAARMAGLEEDLKLLPMAMHTVLQQGGATLSGGQRQRLMIARAIVSRPRVLFFDEATSALDNRTQAIVSQSLQDLQATRVAIAHRLTTITQADRIYVMDRGAVVQTGTYADLIGRDGVFLDLVKRQLL